MLHLMIPKLLFTTLTIKTELYCIRVILYKRYSIKQKEAVIEKTNKKLQPHHPCRRKCCVRLEHFKGTFCKKRKRNKKCNANVHHQEVVFHQEAQLSAPNSATFFCVSIK